MANEVLFADEYLPPRQAEPDAGVPWRVLIVDDDPEVHTVTRLALAKVRFKNRRLEMLSAYSAVQAAGTLRDTPDIAIVLLDVVMETDDAGLRLVRTIREELANHAVRIILRTGQPGQAPEESVILNYDINDYKAKTELTTQKLFTTVVAALRAYSDIVALETSRRGLQQIIESTDRLFELRSMRQFASGVLTQLTAFLGVPANGILCAQHGAPGATHCGDAPAAVRDCHESAHVLAGAGCYSAITEGPIGERAVAPAVSAAIDEAFRTRRTIFTAGHTTLYIRGPDAQEVAAWVQTNRPLSEVDRQLVEVFASKIAISFANVCLYERLREANEQLEARVTERTRALEDANAKLELLATTDALTEVWNRRHFMELAANEVRRAQRYHRPLSVLLFDLDRFKMVNDTYGHAAGDETLRVVVARARQALRATDTIGRFGGEEFVLLLPETDLEQARVVAERVRQAIAGGPVDFDAQRFPVTASIGVAVWQDGEASVEKALRRADTALYEAKQRGRNCIAVA